ncbi:HAD family hydrolase [Melittangium boletus]|uniref:phosphoglycolate phosphatase n=1 Tax=Melittangium boletus DSM 14713 TaxID=1294270 RepID=A0A250IDD4_9BACT|nr:HAD family hydrolase [Melittangium boletus]ATB29137.1 haloacid dehalogenase [Melittangium boletus DSM 14713]
MTLSPRAVIFDLDGTLLDSLHDIGAALNHALSTHGLPLHPLPAYRHFVGEGVQVLVSRALPPGREEMHASVLATYRAFYAEHMFDHTRPFPGIPEVLARLEAEGVKLAVLSNKPDAATRKLVAALLPQVPFVAVYGERAGVPRKPDPTAALAVAAELGVAPGECAFIGDTAVDVETARASGMYAVGVTWGFRDVDELESHGAQVIARTSEELLRALVPAPRAGAASS